MAITLGGLFGGSGNTTLTTNTTAVPSAAMNTYFDPAEQYRLMQQADAMRMRMNISSEDGRKVMIAMRLRLDEGDRFPFQHLSTAKTDDKVFVFVVQNDQPVILEDESALFPSDTLTTQLRLLMK